jgi:hypothetical protein
MALLSSGVVSQLTPTLNYYFIFHSPSLFSETVVWDRRDREGGREEQGEGERWYTILPRSISDNSKLQFALGLF